MEGGVEWRCSSQNVYLSCGIQEKSILSTDLVFPGIGLAMNSDNHSWGYTQCPSLLLCKDVLRR